MLSFHGRDFNRNLIFNFFVSFSFLCFKVQWNFNELRHLVSYVATNGYVSRTLGKS